MSLHFFDPRTYSIQYVMSDPHTKACAIIDPVLDFDEKSGSTATHSADALLDYVRRPDLRLQWILDAHPHADHFSAAAYLKGVTGAPMAIGVHVADVQKSGRGSTIGRICVSMAANGIGCSSMERRSPSATSRLASCIRPVTRLRRSPMSLAMPHLCMTRFSCRTAGPHALTFPEAVPRLFGQASRPFWRYQEIRGSLSGHDYQPGGRGPLWESTVERQKTENIHLKHSGKEEFIILREKRSCMRCRSTSMEASFRNRKSTASATSSYQ